MELFSKCFSPREKLLWHLFPAGFLLSGCCRERGRHILVHPKSSPQPMDLVKQAHGYHLYGAGILSDSFDV